MPGYGKRIAICSFVPCFSSEKVPCTVIDKFHANVYNNYCSQQNMSLVMAYKNIQHKLYPENDLFMKISKNPRIL